MSSLTDKYTKNYSPARKKEFEIRVFDMLGNMSEESAAELVAREMRENKKSGGRVGMARGGLPNVLKL